jgi:hypothetical protein
MSVLVSHLQSSVQGWSGIAEIIVILAVICAANSTAFTTFFLNSVINLFPVDSYVFRCIHTDAYLISFHTQYRDSDLITNHECFADSASQN